MRFIPLIATLIIVPILVRFLLFVAPFIEKERKGIVSLSRITFVLFPLICAPITTVCLTLNIIDKNIGGIVLLSIIEIGLIFMLSYYKATLIKYDDEKMHYKNKDIYFFEIESHGADDDYEVYITKEQYKIKISHFSVGTQGLYKAYEKAKRNG